MTPVAVAPALPLHSAGKYVAGAYIVFIVVVLIYVAIMAVRLGRTERALVELHQDLARRDEARGAPGTDTDTEGRPPVAGAERDLDRDLDREPASTGRPGDSPL